MSKSTLKLVYSAPPPEPELIRSEWIEGSQLVPVRSQSSYEKAYHLGVGCILVRTVYKSAKSGKTYCTVELTTEKNPKDREDAYDIVKRRD